MSQPMHPLAAAEYLLNRVAMEEHPDSPIHALFYHARNIAKREIMPLSQQGDPSDTGCCFAVWRVHPEYSEFHPPGTLSAYSLGSTGIDLHTVPAEKALKYTDLANNEKPSRLSRNPNDLLSCQSRDDKLYRYPGAVRMSPRFNVILAASGLAWECDELLCYVVGEVFGLLTLEEIWQRIEISRNEVACRYYFSKIGRNLI